MEVLPPDGIMVSCSVGPDEETEVMDLTVQCGQLPYYSQEVCKK